MHRWVFLIILFIAVYLGTLVIADQGLPFLSKNEPVETTSPQEITSQPTNAQIAGVKQNAAALPSTLIIPKLGVNTIVEQVGEDSQRRMDVPKNADNVGWYNLGTRPGNIGNAVMAGHFDKETGAPAVFYNLNQLQVGDIMSVKDMDGNEFTYRVTEKVIYPYNQVPLDFVFGATDKSRLNLITCSGAWDTGSRNYSSRTVVYSELVE